MEAPAAARRDPVLAAVLAAFVPGAGLLYAGHVRAGLAVLVAEAALWALGWWLPMLLLHAWQVAVSGGEADVAGERGLDVFDRARRRAAAEGAA